MEALAEYRRRKAAHQPYRSPRCSTPDASSSLTRAAEYFMGQCYLSLDPDERTLAAMCELGLDRNILWASDYPHFDCTYPGVVPEVTRALSNPRPRRTNILRENALRFYKLAP